jgi:hypothetical protein
MAMVSVLQRMVAADGGITMRMQIENAIMDLFLFVLAVLILAGAITAVVLLVDTIKHLVRG